LLNFGSGRFVFFDAASVRRKFGGGKKQMRVELDTSPLIPLPGRGGEEKESAFICG
jgi:hypothetical protein